MVIVAFSPRGEMQSLDYYIIVILNDNKAHQKDCLHTDYVINNINSPNPK
jgi:hypothetical protein